MLRDREFVYGLPDEQSRIQQAQSIVTRGALPAIQLALLPLAKAGKLTD
jgi:N-acetyl-gamma-glutamylphosphate reductase